MGRLSLLLLLSAGCFSGCSSGSDGKVFVALASDFAPFLSWETASIAPDDLGAGHPSGASTVYLSKRTTTRSYPVGTMLVKAFESNPDQTQWDIFAMAKRGGGFNPEGALNWEFFRLRLLSSGQPIIVGRGIFAVDPTVDGGDGYAVLGAAVQGLCNNCHGTQASATTDHVLTPSFAPGS